MDKYEEGVCMTGPLDGTGCRPFDGNRADGSGGLIECEQCGDPQESGGARESQNASHPDAARGGRRRSPPGTDIHGCLSSPPIETFRKVLVCGSRTAHHKKKEPDKAGSRRRGGFSGSLRFDGVNQEVFCWKEFSRRFVSPCFLVPRFPICKRFAKPGKPQYCRHFDAFPASTRNGVSVPAVRSGSPAL